MNYNIYCDESCHLPNDGINLMVLGAITCLADTKRDIFNDIREIKLKHGLNEHFEIKWVKVSPAKTQFYLDIIDYFFKNINLSFRCLVAKNKHKLDHNLYNDGDYNKWYYKMYFLLLDKIIYPDDSHKIYIDIKDTRGGERIKVLHNALCNNIYDFKQEVIKDINQIHSHESEIMQLADLLIGSMSFYYRNLHLTEKPNSAKVAIINKVIELAKIDFQWGSSKEAKKFNLFIWNPRGAL